MRHEFLAFFNSCKTLDKDELFELWRYKFDVHKWQDYDIKLDNGKTVRATQYCFTYKDSAKRGNLVCIYFYRNKPVKVESYVLGLDNNKVLELVKDIKLSPDKFQTFNKVWWEDFEFNCLLEEERETYEKLYEEAN